MVVDRRLRECTEIHESQFGFMPGRSTTDAIFILKQTLEKHREGQKDIRITFIDIEKAYDRVPMEDIWRCTRERNVPETYVKLIQDMYRGCKTKVRSAAGESVDMTEYLDTWRKSLEERGMKVSRPKTQFMDFNNYFKQNQQGNREPVKKLGEELERVTHFKYLGASMEAEGGMETEITKRVGAGWRNCKKCCGVLCDRRIPVKLKGKVYKTVIKPEMLYGAETWATTNRQGKRIEVTEMRMLPWMCGVTRKDNIRNEHIRGTTRVAQASKKRACDEERLRTHT